MSLLGKKYVDEATVGGMGVKIALLHPVFNGAGALFGLVFAVIIIDQPHERHIHGH